MMQGFVPHWVTDEPLGRQRMTCKPRELLPKWAIALLVCTCVALLLFFILGAILHLRRLTHKPSFMWKKQIHKHRVKGPPNEGQVSIVVTDIEGYSGARRIVSAQHAARVHSHTPLSPCPFLSVSQTPDHATHHNTHTHTHTHTLCCCRSLVSWFTLCKNATAPSACFACVARLDSPEPGAHQSL